MPIGQGWYVTLLQVNSFRLSLGLLGRRQPDGISCEIYLGKPVKDPGGREQEERSDCGVSQEGSSPSTMWSAVGSPGTV